MFGLTLSFVATRSGLLRWTDHMTSTDSSQTYVYYYTELNTVISIRCVMNNE